MGAVCAVHPPLAADCRGPWRKGPQHIGHPLRAGRHPQAGSGSGRTAVNLPPTVRAMATWRRGGRRSKWKEHCFCVSAFAGSCRVAGRQPIRTHARPDAGCVCGRRLTREQEQCAASASAGVLRDRARAWAMSAAAPSPYDCGGAIFLVRQRVCLHAEQRQSGQRKARALPGQLWL